jgi:hypothetical protein
MSPSGTAAVRRSPARPWRAVGIALPGALAPALLAIVALGFAPPLRGQDARAAVVGDSIRVGDVVPVAVRLVVAPDERVILPPLLPVEGTDLENASRVRERADTLEDGSVQVTGVYSVTPWRPGTAELPDLAVQVLSADGSARTVPVGLPPLDVLSVLPADPDLLDPRPAKGVLGPSVAWWPIALLLLALLALALLAYAWLRRRRPAAVGGVAAPRRDPRAVALAALEDARRAGHIERGEWKELYTRLALAVREYLEAVDPAWGEELTTTEVVGRVRERAGREHAAAVAAVLRPADQVKFARHEPDAIAATRDLEAAQRWVEGFHWPPAVEQTVEVAA